MNSENEPKKKKSLFKRIAIIVLTALIISAILFIPYHHGIYMDGGTQEWHTVSYIIVKWNRIGEPHRTNIYFFPFSLFSIDNLNNELH